MKIININEISPEKGLPFVIKTLFDEDLKQKGKFTMGIAMISPKTRIPEKGESVHDGDEYAIIMKGSARTVSGGKEYQVSEGQASFIPAGEAHSTFNEGDIGCEVIWVLVKS